jgi:hypothetical protein
VLHMSKADSTWVPCMSHFSVTAQLHTGLSIKLSGQNARTHCSDLVDQHTFTLHSTGAHCSCNTQYSSSLASIGNPPCFTSSLMACHWSQSQAQLHPAPAPFGMLWDQGSPAELPAGFQPTQEIYLHHSTAHLQPDACLCWHQL